MEEGIRFLLQLLHQVPMLDRKQTAKHAYLKQA